MPSGTLAEPVSDANHFDDKNDDTQVKQIRDDTVDDDISVKRARVDGENTWNYKQEPTCLSLAHTASPGETIIAKGEKMGNDKHESTCLKVYET